MDPKDAHRIDQFLALALDVQVRLLAHKRQLMEAGWSEEEAWAWCRMVDSRLLGPVMEYLGEQLEP